MTVVHTYFYTVVYAQRGCHTLKFSFVIKDSIPDHVSYCVFISIIGYRPCTYTKCGK